MDVKDYQLLKPHKIGNFRPVLVDKAKTKFDEYLPMAPSDSWSIQSMLERGLEPVQIIDELLETGRVDKLAYLAGALLDAKIQEAEEKKKNDK